MATASHTVLVRPLITEKATRLAEPRAPRKAAPALGPTYTFQVAVAANKHQIRVAVEGQFGVKVTRVSTQVVPGKSRRRGAQVYRRPARKKALVRLASGQTIDLFPQEG